MKKVWFVLANVMTLVVFLGIFELAYWQPRQMDEQYGFCPLYIPLIVGLIALSFRGSTLEEKKISKSELAFYCCETFGLAQFVTFMVEVLILHLMHIEMNTLKVMLGGVEILIGWQFVIAGFWILFWLEKRA